MLEDILEVSFWVLCERNASLVLQECSLVVDLWSEVVLQNSKGIDFVLNDERLLLVEVKACVSGERGSLVKEVKVADGELLGHWVLNIEVGHLLFASSVVGSQLN